jgi:hypothetical protein
MGHAGSQVVPIVDGNGMDTQGDIFYDNLMKYRCDMLVISPHLQSSGLTCLCRTGFDLCHSFSSHPRDIPHMNGSAVVVQPAPGGCKPSLGMTDELRFSE